MIMTQSGTKPGRGVWESERELRSWLSQDGVEFANDNITVALSLLEASKRIGRSKAKANAPRRGWLVTNAPEAAEDAPEAAVSP